jgi:hypothetical protein
MYLNAEVNIQERVTETVEIYNDNETNTGQKQIDKQTNNNNTITICETKIAPKRQDRLCGPKSLLSNG